MEKCKNVSSRKIISLITTICLFLGLSSPVLANTEQTWDSATSLPDTAGEYVLTQDITLSDTWNVPSGTTKIKLNGHKINTSSEVGTGILVQEATLEIYDSNENNGEIIASSAKSYNSAITVGSEGAVELFGGNISGGGESGRLLNATAGQIIVHSPVTLTPKRPYVTSISITNNGNVTLDSGVTINATGNSQSGVNLTGGTLITSANINSSRSAINCSAGDVTINGGTIKNTHGLEACIFFSGGSLNIFDGEFKGGNGIDIDHRNVAGTLNVYGGHCIGTQTSVLGNANYKGRTVLQGGYFKTAPQNYTLGKRCEIQEQNGQEDWLYEDCQYRVFKYPHEHNFIYSADGATLTATCIEEECTIPDNKVELTIVAPEIKNDTDTDKNANASLIGLENFVNGTNTEVSEEDIKYVGRDGTDYKENDTAPRKAGKYTAELTVQGQTIFVDYEIEKKSEDVSKDEQKVEPQNENKESKNESPKETNKETQKETSIKPVKQMIFAKLTSRGKKSLSVTWNKIKGVSGYDIFFAKCDTKKHTNKFKKVKTIKGNKVYKWTKKGLRKHTTYKLYIKAFITKNGNKTYVSKSPTVHTYTSGGTKTYTNPKKVVIKRTNVSLKEGKRIKINAKVIALSKGKKIISTKHAPKLRYNSSDNNIATVTKTGVIKAIKKGKCKIHVFAINGVQKTVALEVK